MPAAAAAIHFRAHIAQAVLRPPLHLRPIDRRPETGPARTGLEFRLRAKKLLPARRANVYPCRVVVPVLTSERPLRILLPQDSILLRGENPPPLLLRFYYLLSRSGRL